MLRMPLPPEVPLVPRQPCAVCGDTEDVLNMALVEGRWVCERCRDAQPDHGAEGRPAQLPAAASGLDEAETVVPPSVVTLRRVDGTLRFLGLALRTAAYVLLVIGAHRSPVWAHVLTGVLLADVATWAIAAWFDLSRQRFALALELALYLVIGRLWLDAGGTLSLPPDQEGRAITLFGFGAVFSVKIGLFVYKLTNDDRG